MPFSCYACDCREIIVNKYESTVNHYVYEFCDDPSQAYKDKMNFDSWFRGYLQALLDAQTILMLNDPSYKKLSD